MIQADITAQPVDAIVTAANSELRGGGGVDGAVHRAAAPELREASRALAPCPPGSAVVTPAFRLHPVRWVIHAVGPVYSGPGDAPVLTAAYVSALRCADQVGAASVAFPAISTGVFGYPLRDAAHVSVDALRDAAHRVDEVLLVAFDAATAKAWEEALGTSER